MKPTAHLVVNNTAITAKKYFAYFLNHYLTWILALVFGIQAIGFSLYLWFLSQNGYLPSPFFYYKFDSFMDFFNTLYWSYDDGRYTVWKSVYPPLNFIFLKLVNTPFLGMEEISGSVSLRASAFPIVLFILFSYLVVPIIVLKTKLWDRFTITEKTLLFFIFILSSPMLFTLERGNLIIYTLIFIALVLTSKGLFRAFSIAILINLKPYLVLLLFYYLVGRKWKEFWLCTMLSGMLFVVTGILLDHNFLLFFNNLLSFSHHVAIHSTKEILAMPSSISAYSYVLKQEVIQYTTKYSYFFNLHTIAYIISFINWLVLVWTFVALYSKPNRLSDIQIFAILLVVITNLGIWVGGYSLIFYITLLPVFLTMKLRAIYCVILFLLFAPLDFIPVSSESLGEMYSYLTNSIVDVHWTLGLGSLLKPMLNFLLMTTLLYEISQLPNQISVNNKIL